MRIAKILVTGGAGFVGSHLCERLVELGFDVTSLDNYFTGSVDNHVPGVKYVTGYTSDIHSLGRFIEDPDIVYHLGEYSRVEQSFDDFSKVWDYNIIGTKTILEYVKYTRAKLIYAGSSTKFADVDMKSPYQWSKASNTEFVKNWCEWHDLDYAITYFYNVYGKREISHGKYATLIAKYRERMRQGQTLPVVSPGNQKRNFTHVDDIVDALILIGHKGYGDEYGIGSNIDYRITEVAELFGGEIEMLPERKGNRMSAPVVDTKTRDLGWEPKRHLADWIHDLRKNNWSVK
jgi:UDP-glucose 4-epimerase